MNNTNQMIFERDGYQLKVEQFGQGPNLLVIGCVDYYKKVMPQTLHNHFTCLYLDHRGFALHDGVDSPINLEVISSDIEHICQHLNIKSASVFGHSGHAYMAIHFANQTSLIIDKVIVVGAAPSLSRGMQEKQFAHWSQNASEERRKLLEKNMAMLESDITNEPERKFVHICRRLGPMRWADPKFDELELWMGVETNTVLLDKLWGELFRDIDLTILSNNLNLTVINGSLDFSIAPLHTWQCFKSAFKSLKLIELKGVSHTPMLECPEKFVDTMAKIQRTR
ncbi:alpha/beta fold hydrolase [Shewanella baltica]|uniref:alpha/beta fold hydrolase n=2 Tax=Shewanellaceae TaxID=267890 RepID=UPI00014F8C6F|nr:alpha/beta hydrolase [Shewanella baltica]ABS09476.1 alpha/beta hydrolase fold [Shewanella baltica OS185]NSM25162.1 alpha/beta hydrolase [Shewanella sp. ZOR0012]